MNLTLQLTNIMKIAKASNDFTKEKYKIKNLLNAKSFIKKGLENNESAELTQAQYKILAEFFLNIMPELANEDVMVKMIRYIKQRNIKDDKDE